MCTPWLRVLKHKLTKMQSKNITSRLYFNCFYLSHLYRQVISQFVLFQLFHLLSSHSLQSTKYDYKLSKRKNISLLLLGHLSSSFSVQDNILIQYKILKVRKRSFSTVLILHICYKFCFKYNTIESYLTFVRS